MDLWKEGFLEFFTDGTWGVMYISSPANAMSMGISGRFAFVSWAHLT